MSGRRACKASGFCRMTIRYETRRDDDQKLRERMKALADERRPIPMPKNAGSNAKKGVKLNRRYYATDLWR
jgi:hypothetical protein